MSAPTAAARRANFHAIRLATEHLRGEGHEVVSPVEIDDERGVTADEVLPDAEYARILAEDIRIIAEEGVEAIVVLPSWESSGGAQTEVAYARACGLPILTYPGLDSVEGEPRPNGMEYDSAGVRVFESGATRDLDHSKLDYEGFLSPLVLWRFAEYMHENRHQKDGTLRDSDNWQKGIPLDAYVKSGWRHHMDWWLLHRGHAVDADLERTLCALIFNISGYLHEYLRAQ